MRKMKLTLLKNGTIVMLVILFACSLNAQTEHNHNHNHSDMKKEVNSSDKSQDIQDVENILIKYKRAIENLNADQTLELFDNNSEVFESGGTEGTYAHYLDHHLGPELKVFKSFNFSDYKVETKVDLPYAFTTETYVYTIVIKANEEKGREERTISKKGVATAILKKENDVWRILKYHSSSRANKAHSH